MPYTQYAVVLFDDGDMDWICVQPTYEQAEQDMRDWLEQNAQSGAVGIGIMPVQSYTTI